jgi:Fe2+ transport system protein FeoA
VVVVEVEDRDSELLRYLGDLRLFPGTTLEVIRVEPCDGPLVLTSGDREIIIGRAAAAEIRVIAQ